MIKVTPNYFLEVLKTDLALRSNNDHVGSRLGGNPSQFYFLLSRIVKAESTDEKNVSFKEINGSVTICVPNDLDISSLKQAREALNEFFLSHPDKNDFTQELIISSTFFQDQKDDTLDLTLLKQAISYGLDLKNYLNPKIELSKHIDAFFEAELSYLKKSFLERTKEIALSSLFYKSPFWGPKISELSDNRQSMRNYLLTQDVFTKIKVFKTFPTYIIAFVIRSTVGIDSLVGTDLDLDENFDFLDNIASTLDSITKI